MNFFKKFGGAFSYRVSAVGWPHFTGKGFDDDDDDYDDFVVVVVSFSCHTKINWDWWSVFWITVDFGCGSGRLRDSLMEHSTALESIVGVDISRKGLTREAKV